MRLFADVHAPTKSVTRIPGPSCTVTCQLHNRARKTFWQEQVKLYRSSIYHIICNMNLIAGFLHDGVTTMCT